MRMLRWMWSYNKIQDTKWLNDCILGTIGAAPIEKKIIENQLRWFGHVHRRPWWEE